jgi:hypothetical protein
MKSSMMHGTFAITMKIGNGSKVYLVIDVTKGSPVRATNVHCNAVVQVVAKKNALSALTPGESSNGSDDPECGSAGGGFLPPATPAKSQMIRLIDTRLLMKAIVAGIKQ